MKNKLTLTIEGGVTHRAKTLARRRGKSFSQLVEELLTREMNECSTSPELAPSERETFSKRWAGKMELAESADPRFRKLMTRYGLETGE